MGMYSQLQPLKHFICFNLTPIPIHQTIKSLFSAQNEQYQVPTRLLEKAAADAFARKIPNADLGTAVDVLITGEWQRVPTRYKVGF